MSSVEPSATTITIARSGQHLYAPDSEQLERIGGPLFARSVHKNESADHFSMRPGVTELFPNRNRHCANLGLWTALRTRASLRGIELRLDQNDTNPISQLPQPSTANLQFPQLSDFVFQHPLGVIQHSKSITPALLIRELHRAFPRERIVVIHPHRQRQTELFRQLAPYINSIDFVTARRSLPWNDLQDLPRVLIAGPYDVVDYDHPSCDIIILPEARTCCHERIKNMLSQVDLHARIYGFHPQRFALSPFESDQFMAQYGPQQLDLIKDSKVTRPVNLVRLPFRNRYQKRCDQIHFAKSLYWKNSKRNNQISRIAQELSSGQRRVITEFLAFDNCHPQPGECPKITILVDRPMHAMELSDRLDEWPVLIDPAILTRCSGQFRHRVQNQTLSWHGNQRQIMLTDVAQNSTIEDVDILIWAAGTPFTDGIPDRFFRSAPDRVKPLLIIDFEDSGNRDTRAFSESRKQEFYQRAIFPPGISPAQGRVALFLNHQPH